MIVLFTTYYNETHTTRKAELLEAINRNIGNPVFDRVFILNEGGDLSQFGNPKLNVITIEHRPFFADFFNVINTELSVTDIAIIANTDIYFDLNIRILHSINLDKICITLSRWNIDNSTSIRLYEHGDSQDVWIFKGRINDIKSNIPIGVYDCDNKIAYEIEQAGYRLINPAFSIRSYHLHLSNFRLYEIEPQDYGIRPPFRYIEPDNAGNIFFCLYLYFRYRMSYFPYRITCKKVKRFFLIKLWLRISNKIKSLLK